VSRSTKKNFAYNAVYQIFKVLTPLLTTPYLSRVLGPEGVGTYSYTFSITGYFVAFAALGMTNYGARVIATARDDRRKLSQTFWSAYFNQLIVGAVVLVVYVVYSLTIAQGGTLICALWTFYLLSALADVSWLLFGVEEFRIPTMRSILVKAIELVLIFACVKSEGDLWIYIAIDSFIWFANQALLWPFIRRYVDWVRPTWKQVSVHFKPNLGLFVPVIAISLYTNMDKVILGAMTDVVQSGYLDYSEKMSKIPLAVIQALGTVMLPRMAATIAQGRIKEARGLVEYSAWFMLAGSLGLAFAISAVAPEFVPVFFGDDYLPCIELMIVISLVVPLISSSNIIGKQYLLPTFRDRYYTLSVIAGALVNVALNLMLVPSLQAMGAAIANVAAEASVLAVQASVVRKELPLGRYLKNALPFTVMGIIMCAVVRLAASVLTATLGVGVLSLVIEMALAGAVFLGLAFVWCKRTHEPYYDRFMGPFRRRLGLGS